MKRIGKKLIALLTTLIMLFAMSVTAFAGESGSHSIVIHGGDYSLDGVTFSAYKLFDLTVSGEKYGYTPTADFEEWLNGKVTASQTSTYDYVSEQMANANTAQTFLAALKEQLSSKTAAATVTGTTEKTATLTRLTNGYYVIYSDSNDYAPLAVNVKTDDADVYVKALTPDITKTVGKNDTEWIGAQIGDTIPFTVKVKVPNTTGSYGNYTFKVCDTMSDGLTFNKESVTITVGGDSLTAGTDYTLKTEDIGEKTLELDFVMNSNNPFLRTKLLSHIGEEMTITYSATLNENADVITPETNKAELHYTNQEGVVVDGNTAPNDGTKVYTYQYNVLKKAETDTGTVLPNAEFRVYKGEECTHEISFVEITTGTEGKYRVAVSGETGVPLVSDNEGKINFYGLKAGTYYLKEVKAPDGYNMLKDPVSFTITADQNGAQNGTTEVTVVNKSGTLLPSTGGNGAMVIAGAGFVIVVAGLAMLMRNRKKSS